MQACARTSLVTSVKQSWVFTKAQGHAPTLNRTAAAARLCGKSFEVCGARFCKVDAGLG
jgi:hypothetical protein